MSETPVRHRVQAHIERAHYWRLCSRREAAYRLHKVVNRTRLSGCLRCTYRTQRDHTRCLEARHTSGGTNWRSRRWHAYGTFSGEISPKLAVYHRQYTESVLKSWKAVRGPPCQTHIYIYIYSNKSISMVKRCTQVKENDDTHLTGNALDVMTTAV